MSRDSASRSWPGNWLPRWGAYALAIIAQVLLTWLVLGVVSSIPSVKYHVPLFLCATLIAYLLGAGPGILAAVVGFVCLRYYLTPPVHSLWPMPTGMRERDYLGDYIDASVIMIAAVVLVQRTKGRIQSLANELDRQKTLMDVLLQNVPVGIGFMDHETKHLLVNRALADMVGMRMEDMIGRTIGEALPSVLVPAAAEHVRSVLATGEPTVIEDTELPGGRHYRVQHLPVRAHDGEVLGVAAVIVDITESVESRKELERLYVHEHRVADALQSAIVGAYPRTSADSGSRRSTEPRLTKLSSAGISMTYSGSRTRRWVL